MKNKNESKKTVFIDICDYPPILNHSIEYHMSFYNTLSSGFCVKASGQTFPANGMFPFPPKATLLTNKWMKGQRPSQQQIAGNKYIGSYDSTCHVTVLFWSDWRSIPPVIKNGQTF